MLIPSLSNLIFDVIHRCEEFPFFIEKHNFSHSSSELKTWKYFSKFPWSLIARQTGLIIFRSLNSPNVERGGYWGSVVHFVFITSIIFCIMWQSQLMTFLLRRKILFSCCIRMAKRCFSWQQLTAILNVG